MICIAGTNPFRSNPMIAQILLMSVQIGALWAVGFLCNRFVATWHLPVPGFVFGMATLYALLALKIVRVAWVDAGGSLLVRHLGFFFIPIDKIALRA